MKFIHQYDENSPLIEVTLHKDSDLSEVFEAFAGFLRAAGYVFDGNLEIINEESN